MLKTSKNTNTIKVELTSVGEGSVGEGTKVNMFYSLLICLKKNRTTINGVKLFGLLIINTLLLILFWKIFMLKEIHIALIKISWSTIKLVILSTIIMISLNIIKLILLVINKIYFKELSKKILVLLNVLTKKLKNKKIIKYILISIIKINLYIFNDDINNFNIIFLSDMETSAICILIGGVMVCITTICLIKSFYTFDNAVEEAITGQYNYDEILQNDDLEKPSNFTEIENDLINWKIILFFSTIFCVGLALIDGMIVYFVKSEFDGYLIRLKKYKKLHGILNNGKPPKIKEWYENGNQ